MRRKLCQKLISWKNSRFRKPLVLYGARQVGKTHALKHFGKTQFNRTFYLNFEERRDELNRLFSSDVSSIELKKKIELMFGETIDLDHDLVILDEIQECPRALTSLKYFNETLQPLAVCAAGSHLGITLNEESFPVGKVDILHAYPMDFEEFLNEEDGQLASVLHGMDDFSQIDEFLHARLWESMKSYYVTGGLPAVVTRYLHLRESPADAFNDVRSTQKSLVTGYVSDFSKHAGKENANHIHRIFESIPVQLGRETDASSKRYRFKGVIPNKAKYSSLAGPIDWLVTSGLAMKVHITETPSIPLKAYVKENMFKLYLFDVGILGAMLDLPYTSLLAQDYGMYKGFFAENFVAQQFHASGMRELYSWTHRNAEVEFLRTFRETVVPVEVKSGQRTRAKSLSVYARRYAPSRMFRISGQRYAGGRTVINYPLYLAGKIRPVDT